MEKTKFEELNGLDVARLEETVESIKQSPELAEFKFRCENEWHTGAHNSSEILGFYGAGQEDTSRHESFHLHADEPDILLGEDNGANPTETLLHALASCVTTSLVFHATAKGLDVKGVSSSLEGQLNLNGFLGLKPGTTVGFQLIKAEFRIEGDFSQEQKEEILRMGCEHSPVFNSLKGCVPIETRVV